jgi:acyl-CoA synthetase (NDP forming)
MKTNDIRRIIDTAREKGRDVLLETEGIALLEAIGFKAPRHVFIRKSADAAGVDLEKFDGDRVVVKVISPEILHKSDVGGVAFVPRDASAIRSAIADMETKFKGRAVEGYTVHQMVSYDRSLGNELLLGLRWTPDFGPVVVFGAGGIYTEFLAESFKTGRDLAILSAEIPPIGGIGGVLDHVAVMPLLTGGLRGQKPRIARERIEETVRTALEFAREFCPRDVSEFEVNPFVASGGDLVALDVVVKLSKGAPALPPLRPIRKLEHLLTPRSVAVMGVSEKMNPGHVILNNLIREGFDKNRIFVVKPGIESIEGCRCYPTIASLPEKVDLLVLSVDAQQATAAVTEIANTRKAESVIVIPGGLEEKIGTENFVGGMHAALRAARGTEWGGPVINGGNCLGIRSLPGRYDTMFIAPYKIGLPEKKPAPVAIISQSGAWSISKNNKVSCVNPLYTISFGNQMDLTVGDYLAYLKDDPAVDIFAVYVEGFKALDGLHFLKQAKEIAAMGKTVILYKAGRTSAGAKASASHTASIAGDYPVTRELCANAGVIVADTIADYEDLVMLFSCLKDKHVAGWRLGALSNAGFESVAMADNIGRFRFENFSAATDEKLRAAFKIVRIDTIVDVHNPLDLTPQATDAVYEAIIRAMIEDENVDVGLVGCVPMTQALNTLVPGEGHPENLYDENGIVARMKRIKDTTTKAWAAVVDAGPIYDEMARLLKSHEIPTFRTADRALRLFHRFCEEKLKTTARGRQSR